MVNRRYHTSRPIKPRPPCTEVLIDEPVLVWEINDGGWPTWREAVILHVDYLEVIQPNGTQMIPWERVRSWRRVRDMEAE